MATTFSVDLTVAMQTNYMLDSSLGFRLTITASNPSAQLTAYNVANGGSAATAICVFRYYQKPARPDGVIESVFSGVCSWPDYLEISTISPPSDTLPANFRQNYIDIVVESETVGNEVWELIKTQVTQLMQTMADGQVLVTGETFSAIGAT